MAKVAFIGLGVMGYPMAGHLAKRGGHELTVYNRTAEKADEMGRRAWRASRRRRRGRRPRAPISSSPASAMTTTCAAVTLGRDGALAGMKAGRDPCRQHHRLGDGRARARRGGAAKRGVGFLDAPVSGGQAGAENGQLTVMVGGEQATFDKAKPVIDAYAKMVGLMGPAGAGQLTKMVNQICIAGLVQGLAEGIHFARHAGLDVEKVIGVISKGAAQSWQMENR